MVENTNLELSKVKSDLSDIKSMMNEVLQVVAEKDTITKEIEDTEITQRFKNIEKVILPFLYNLSKSDEPYIHWPPNRGPIIKAQIDKVLELTRGKMELSKNFTLREMTRSQTATRKVYQIHVWYSSI